MNVLQNLLAVIALVLVLYVAFLVGTVLLRIVLGLIAIGLVVWLVSRLFSSRA